MRAFNAAISLDDSNISYLGHPSGGFFFRRDRRIASFQSPSILSMSGLGPRFAPVPRARFAVFRFAAFLVAITPHFERLAVCTSSAYLRRI